MTAEKFADADLRFEACLAFTLKYEGGRSNDLHDPGGRTMQGVTQAVYDAYRAKHGNTRADVFAMDAAERDAIYRTEYWNKVTGNSLPQGVDLCVFDYGVNSGPARALRAYASAAHGRDPAEAIHAVCSARLSFLHALRTWTYFGAGWGRRVAACETIALKMAGAPLEISRAKMQAKKNGADGAAVVVAGSGVAVVMENLHLHWLWIAAGAVVLTAAILAFVGKGRSAVLRMEALSAAIGADRKTQAAPFTEKK